MSIIVVDYDTRWPQLFESLRGPVGGALGELALGVEHVGSTAVPGLAAKPIIDLDVVVRPGDVAAGVVRLEALGYRHRGDLGIAQREAFAAPSHTPAHNLYLCPQGSPALANHLAVRDYLRGNPAAVRAYGQLKKQLALEHPGDIERYVEGKTPFLLGVLREVGFAPSELAAIELMNRAPKRV